MESIKHSELKAPIKVLFVLDTFRAGGNETSAIMLANHLNKLKFDPTILVLNKQFVSKKMLEKAHSDGIKLIVMEAFPNTFKHFFEYLRVLRTEKCKISISFANSYKLALLQPLNALFGIGRGYLRLSGSPPEAISSIKLIITMCMSNFFYSKTIAVSYSVKEWAEKVVRNSNNKNIVICNGVSIPETNFYLRNHTNNESIVVMTARLENAKDHKTLIEAMSKVQVRLPLAKLYLVGDGPMRKELEAYALAVGCEALFFGESCNVQDIIKRATIFVLSTHTEGFPNALLEAMALGIPVLASDIKPCAEILGDGQYGKLFYNRNSINLAHLILELLVDEAALKLQSNLAYQRAKKYDVRKMVAQYESVLLS